MDIFELIGPIMVGPSSSHTAGAARIGYVARKILGQMPVKAELCLLGSFAATGAGHGTDKALVAGLLDMTPDDERIPDSFTLARQQGLDFHFSSREAAGVHPNTVELHLWGREHRELRLRAESIGGGRIQVRQLDGMELCFTAEKPTLIVRNEDQPGSVADVSRILSQLNINIATFHVNRSRRGGQAIMVIECDTPIDQQICRHIASIPGILSAIFINP